MARLNPSQMTVPLQFALARYQAALACLDRLYIRDKNYPQAIALLERGLQLAEEQNSFPEVRYSLFKNLGWARFEQGRDELALPVLQAAIGITASHPEAAKYFRNPGSAHCLLAQVLERQEKPGALAQWQHCSELGSRTNPEEDTWLYLAQQKLSQVKGGKKQP